MSGGTVLVAGAPARADCPEVDASATCDSGLTNPVCRTLTDWFECNLAANGGSSGGTATAVHNPDDLCDGEYCVWGVQATGDEFCCEFDPSDGEEDYLIVLGTDYADLIELYYSCDDEYDLNNHGGVLVFEGRVSARGGGDLIYGSRIASSAYHDELHGDGGDDEIRGQEGPDELHGDADTDEIFGGPGNDSIWGGGETDYLSGNGGSDVIFAGPGQDNVSGGSGADYLHGDDGADTICGDDDGDELTGDSSTDILWGGAGTDDADGGLHTDTCLAEDEEECEEDPASGDRPMSCPPA